MTGVKIEQGKGRSQQAALRHRETWLLPFTRVALALASAGTGTTAAREQLSERVVWGAPQASKRCAAWDLVVCAILVGSLIYADAAALEVGDTFFGLGAAITLLLLSAVALRVRIERGLVPRCRARRRKSDRAAPEFERWLLAALPNLQ